MWTERGKNKVQFKQINLPNLNQLMRILILLLYQIGYFVRAIRLHKYDIKIGLGLQFIDENIQVK